MVNNAVVSHNSVNELYYLEEVDSTNTWAKANLDKFGPVGAVYTTSQTAGRGRRGHTWINASGQALYYTVVLKTELAQPESLPLFASMAVADALEQRYGIQCQIKWPNDLLLNGKKIVGILCEGMPDHHAIVCGIGINLAQPQSYFDAMELPHGTSLALQGIAVDPAADAAALAGAIQNAHTKLHRCRICQNYTEADICPICASAKRDPSVICVVETPRDVQAFERTREYHGLYHVLHGLLSPMDGITAEQLCVKELLARLGDGKVKEVIMAMNPTVEGEATAMYLAKLIKPLGIKTTRLAYGLPVGASLEYTDETTLYRALSGRGEL